ncbi:RHS repeat-associated core domain-containing protein [Photobacterium damselae]|uniref:RHS repeat-associated core domain-containing protein n=1 Tax=Photobacterium damselae TaxID=38293 RepID=UPI002F3FA29D
MEFQTLIISPRGFMERIHYSPKTGRFTTVDPIGLAGGLNNYQYVPNPVNWVDPLGLMSVDGNGCQNNLSKRNNVTSRLPKNYGKWVEGDPGNGFWKSSIKEVNLVTNNEPIPFINSRPVFDKWSKGSLKYEEGVLNGSRDDFNLVYDDIMVLKNLNSRNAARKLLKENSLTPHHNTETEIQLVPTALYGNIPHIGSASYLRKNNG